MARLMTASRPRLLLATLLSLAMIFLLLSYTALSGSAASGKGLLEHASNLLSMPSVSFGKSGTGMEVSYNQMNSTSKTFTMKNRERVLILTPLAKFYQEYWDNLLGLHYPHELISLGFIIPNNEEGDVATAALEEQIEQWQKSHSLARRKFAEITILRQNTATGNKSLVSTDRHSLDFQRERRATMARARNSLLFNTIKPTTSWVLWLDGDIVETPRTLIEDLASHEKPIIVANCYQRYDRFEGEGEDAKRISDVRHYDLNNWVESVDALRLAEGMPETDILVEGYADLPTHRSNLVYMLEDENIPGGRDAWKEVKLDGVGGTTLLVKAEVHQAGAIFPPFPFHHLIETEGFARLAKEMGYQSWGLPNYLVYHRTE